MHFSVCLCAVCWYVCCMLVCCGCCMLRLLVCYLYVTYVCCVSLVRNAHRHFPPFSSENVIMWGPLHHLLSCVQVAEQGMEAVGAYSHFPSLCHGVGSAQASGPRLGLERALPAAPQRACDHMAKQASSEVGLTSSEAPPSKQPLGWG